MREKEQEGRKLTNLGKVIVDDILVVICYASLGRKGSLFLQPYGLHCFHLGRRLL